MSQEVSLPNISGSALSVGQLLVSRDSEVPRVTTIDALYFAIQMEDKEKIKALGLPYQKLIEGAETPAAAVEAINAQNKAISPLDVSDLPPARDPPHELLKKLLHCCNLDELEEFVISMSYNEQVFKELVILIYEYAFGFSEHQREIREACPKMTPDVLQAVLQTIPEHHVPSFRACQALLSQDLAQSVSLLNADNFDPTHTPGGDCLAELFCKILLLSAERKQTAILKTSWVQQNKWALVSALSSEIQSFPDYQRRVKLREAWLKSCPRDGELKYYHLSEVKFKRIYLVQCLIYVATHDPEDLDFEKAVQVVNNLWNSTKPSDALLEEYMLVPTLEYPDKIARGVALFLLHRKRFMVGKGPLEELSKETYELPWRNLLDMVFYHLFSHHEDELISAVFNKYPSLKTEFFYAFFSGFQGEWDASMLTRLMGIFGEDLSGFYQFVLKTAILEPWPGTVPKKLDVARIFSISIELAQHQAHQLREALLDRDFLGRSNEIWPILMSLCIFYRFPEGMRLMNRFFSISGETERYVFTHRVDFFASPRLGHSLRTRVLHPEEYSFLLLSFSQLHQITSRLCYGQSMLAFLVSQPERVMSDFNQFLGVPFERVFDRILLQMINIIWKYVKESQKRKITLPDELIIKFSEKYIEVLPTILEYSGYAFTFFRPVFLPKELLGSDISEPDQDCLMELEIEHRMLDKWVGIFRKGSYTNGVDELVIPISCAALAITRDNTALLFQHRVLQIREAVEVHEEPALAPLSPFQYDATL